MPATLEGMAELLVRYGYEETSRKEGISERLTDPTLCLSFFHQSLFWAHISRFERSNRTVVECVLFPNPLDRHSIHNDLQSLEAHLMELTK